MSDHKEIVVITGASAGIGHELCKLFARDGYSLLVTARSADKLRALADELDRAYGATVTVCPLDLADPRAPEQLLEASRDLGGPVDVLVNNAGFGTFGPFAEADLATTLQLLQVNVVALTHLTRLLLPGMVAQRQGRILNVASTAAFQPGPLMAVYYASKAYVLHFSEALAEELSATGVSVTALCPGPTATEFLNRAGAQLFAGIKVMDAGAVADIGYRGLMRGKRVVVPGFRNKLLAQARRLLPRRLLTAIVGRFQEGRRT